MKERDSLHPPFRYVDQTTSTGKQLLDYADEA